MTRKHLQGIALLLILCGILAMGSHCEPAAAADWKGERETIEGIVHIRNPKTPIQSAQTIRPREIWRIGEEPDDLTDEDELIGYINEIMIDEDGNYYLLDRAFSHIKIYSPQGKFLRIIGREGEGPGEFRQPGGFYFQKNGNIAIAQMMPGRLIIIDRQGIPAGNISFSELGGMGMNILHKVEGGPGFGLISMMITSMTDQGVSMNEKWFSIDDEGNLIQTYLEKSQESSSRGGNVSIEVNAEDEIGRLWSQSEQGDAYIARSQNEYKIEVFNPRGTLVKVIERDYESVKLTEEELEAMAAQMPQLHNGGAEVEMGFNEYKRDVIGIYPRPNGELWVATSATDVDCQKSGICTLDVFDGEGRFVRQQNITADYDPRYDNFQLVDDHLFIFKEAKTTPQTSSSSAGGMMMVMVEVGSPVVGGDEDREPEPFRVICYEL